MKTRLQIEISEMKELRKITGNTRRDRERNENIKRKCMVEIYIGNWMSGRRIK